jgi:hypothetical protein
VHANVNGLAAYRQINPLHLLDVERDNTLTTGDLDRIRTPQPANPGAVITAFTAPAAKPSTPMDGPMPNLNYNSGLIDFGISGPVNETDWLVRWVVGGKPVSNDWTLVVR